MAGAHMILLFEPDDSKATTIKVIAATTVGIAVPPLGSILKEDGSAQSDDPSPLHAHHLSPHPTE
jgi:hypothetical protein